MQSLWIDTDCGIDDALALLVALAHPATRVVGISCSFGNVAQDAVIQNVRRVLRVAAASGRPCADVPVYYGASEPLRPNAVHSSCSWIHGVDGLGDCPEADAAVGVADLPLPPLVGDETAGMAAMAAAARAGPLDVLMLGPGTFLAHALDAHPDIAQQLGRVFIMGGAFPAQFAGCVAHESSNMKFEGNMAESGMPNAEHNVACCPDSIQRILDDVAGEVIFIDWALTCKEPWLWADFEAGVAAGRCGKWYGLITSKLVEKEHSWGAEGFLVCDPLAAVVTVALNNAVDRTARGTVAVTTDSELCELGKTTLAPHEDGKHVVITGLLYSELNKELLRACA